MGCKKLTYQNFSFLEVIHPKKKVSAEKKRLKDYVGNYIYENGNLQFFNTAEGYVQPDGSGNYSYVYQYLDHLGNVRISYSDNVLKNGIIEQNEIIEESNYYPFGLKHKGYNSGVSSIGNSVAQKRKYNGKELEEDLGLNTYSYGWRDYDPAIGRFNKIDRFAEKYMSINPYNYTANNPVRFVDIAGDSINLGNLYDRNAKGKLKYADLVYAFEIFASSKSGKKWIKDRAQKGFKINSEFVKGANFEATEEGSLSNSGIDIAYNVGDKFMDDTSADGETGMSVKNGRLKLSFNFSSSHGTRSFYENRFNSKVAVSLKEMLHESHYHGTFYENRFLNLPSSQRSFSNIYSDANNNHSLDINGNLKQSLYNATYILNRGQGILKVQNPKSIQYLYYNVLLKSINLNYRRNDIKK